jgi:hypothetical protein
VPFDLLIKAACFVKKGKKILAMSKATYLKYKEVNCIEPSPLVRVPFSYQYNHYFVEDW